MPTLWIREYDASGFPSNEAVPLANEAANTRSTATPIDGTSRQSDPFLPDTRLVGVQSDVGCWVDFGRSPTAAPGSGERITGNQPPRYFGVNGRDMIAVAGAFVYGANGVDGVTYDGSAFPGVSGDIQVSFDAFVSSDFAPGANVGVVGHATSMTGAATGRQWAVQWESTLNAFRWTYWNGGGFSTLAYAGTQPRDRWVSVDILMVGGNVDFTIDGVTEQTGPVSSFVPSAYAGGERCIFVGSGGGVIPTAGLQIKNVNVTENGVPIVVAPCQEGDGLVSENNAPSVGDGVISAVALHEVSRA